MDTDIREKETVTIKYFYEMPSLVTVEMAEQLINTVYYLTVA